MGQGLNSSYEVKVVKPLVAKVVVNEGTVFIRVFPIPAYVRVQDDGIAVGLKGVLTVETSKPRMELRVT